MGLSVGGDDYVTKPFSLDEVVARIRAVLRRTQPMQADDAVIRVDDLELDDDAHEVAAAASDRAVPHRIQAPALPHAEPQPGAVQGADPGPCLGVRLQRRRLDRRVLHFLSAAEDGHDPDAPALIQTKRGVGYVLRTAEKR